MPTVLLTAFEPYDRWPENASWLALVELTRDLPVDWKVVTRRYPVDFAVMQEKLSADLAANFDFALHLGQAPGNGRIHLEAIGINVAGNCGHTSDECQPLAADGPAAYHSQLPLAALAASVRQVGIPCQVSHHAGTYLCNALLYLSQHFSAQRRLKTRCTFLHLPLAPQQVLHDRQDWPTLPSAVCAEAIRIILGQLVGEKVA